LRKVYDDLTDVFSLFHPAQTSRPDLLSDFTLPV